ncbi:flagellar basal body-associated FliL family protein [Microvirga roseola]|uniref:flagellar basal body-associated FliL family protein n=1 Tax=Microvirga roseola TaxID=2883126 RepID=UPI001E61104F|nr:flagellar basal body-associated FliL family protein [Microvirga roseola]
MSEESLALPPPATETKKSGLLGVILTFLVLSLLAVAVGGGSGILMVSSIEKSILEKHQAKAEEKVSTSPYSGDIAVRRLAPVVTNLANSENEWIRLEFSIVYKNVPGMNPDVAAAEIRQDVLAYLRTLSIAQIQGPSGLLHLREDLNERVKLRSNGEVKEITIETLVVQ